MKIALQYTNKQDGCTMALFSKPKRKFRIPSPSRRNGTKVSPAQADLGALLTLLRSRRT